MYFLVIKKYLTKWIKDGKVHRNYDLPAIFHKSGTKEWWKHNQKHRENDLPAVEYANGDKEWWCCGRRHRDNGPAIILCSHNYQRQEWWFRGQRHRGKNLPATIIIKEGKEFQYFYEKGSQYNLLENGTKEFFDFGGRLNRHKDLPAIEYPNGDKEWWKKGKRHRKDGPAIIYGEKQFWFVNGEFIKCSP